jgi:ParB-like chromosome segregation protein Spo0J
MEQTNQTACAAGPLSDIELKISKIPISNLRPDPANPRIHSRRQIKQLAKSIKTFGFVSPVLIDGMQRVVAGHGRIEAMKLLGRTEFQT